MGITRVVWRYIYNTDRIVSSASRAVRVDLIGLCKVRGIVIKDRLGIKVLIHEQLWPHRSSGPTSPRALGPVPLKRLAATRYSRNRLVKAKGKSTYSALLLHWRVAIP